MILYASINLGQWIDHGLLKQSTSIGHVDYFQFFFHKWQLDLHLWGLFLWARFPEVELLGQKV